MVSLASDPRIAAALKGKAGLLREGSGSGQILSGYSPVSGLGWTVLVESKAAVALAEIYAVVGTVLILTGIVSLIFLGGAVVIVLVMRGRDRDAAQIRSLNAELAQRAAVTQAVLDNIADGIAVSDEQGSLSFNPAAERIMGTKVTGASPEQWPQAYGLFMPDRVTPYPPADLPMARARRGESVQQADIFVRPPGQPDGIWINVSASPLRIDGKLVGGISIFRDVTAAKRHQDAVTKLNAELAQRVAERDATNKELEAFTYSVSHDLRAPLRAIHGFVRILQEEHLGNLEAEGRRYLDLVATNAAYMGQLVDDLLQFSRTGRQGLTKQPVLTTAVARRAIEELRPSLGGREVQFRLGELPACQADPTLLLQVYVNLIGNAIKYTRGRQPAVIEVGSLTGQHDGPVYFVKDNGTGFDMQYAHKLFGVFQRLHRSEDYEGTGVGLAIVHRIVTRHGGRVWAEAEQGKGATFYFTLGGTAAWQPSIAA
jgi:signal transduction histidine kinase